MSKSSYRERKKPIKKVHTIIWALAGTIFLLISIICTIVMIPTAIASTFFVDQKSVDVSYYLKNTGQILLFVGLCVLFGYSGYGLIRRGIQADDEKTEFDRANTTTEAKVLKRYERVIKARKSDPYDQDIVKRYVIIQFETDAGPISLEAEISHRLYKRISTDENLEVKYFNSDPSVALIQGEYRNTSINLRELILRKGKK